MYLYWVYKQFVGFTSTGSLFPRVLEFSGEDLGEHEKGRAELGKVRALARVLATMAPG